MAKILKVPNKTTAERLALANIPAGTKVFDTDLAKEFITEDGGATPTWTQVTSTGSSVTLQDAYADGDGKITLDENKPVEIISSYNSVAASFTIANPGSGYAFGDQLEPAGGVAVINARIIVAAVDGGGGILGVGLIPTSGNSGVYSTDPAPLAANPVVSITGSGVGAQIDLTMEPSGQLKFNPSDFSALTMDCDHGYLTLPVINAGFESGIPLPEGAIRFLNFDSKYHVGIGGGDETLITSQDLPTGANQVYHNDGSGNLTSSSNVTASNGGVALGVSGTAGFLTMTNMSPTERDAVPSQIVGHLNLNTVTDEIEVRTSAGWVGVAQEGGLPIFNGVLVNPPSGVTTTIDISGVDVSTDGTETNLTLQLFNDSSSSKPTISTINGRGTQSAKVATVNGDALFNLNIAGTTTSLTNPIGASISAIADGTISATAVPTRLQLIASDDDALTSSIVLIKPDGSMDLSGVNGTNRKLSLGFQDGIDLETDDLRTSSEYIRFDKQVVSASYAPCSTLRVIADGAIQVGAPLTASTSTAFRVVQIATGDPDSTPVIGFAVTSAAAAGDEIEVCAAQLLTVQMDAVDTAGPGDPVEKSDTTIGRVQSTPISPGTFGVAAETAASNAFFKIWLKRNEQF